VLAKFPNNSLLQRIPKPLSSRERVWGEVKSVEGRKQQYFWSSLFVVTSSPALLIKEKGAVWV
jgi:hypothetical protein